MLPINRKITKVNFNDRNTNPKYIVIHYVGAVSTAANNASYFYNTYRGASAHYFVDEKSIWQVVEDNDTAWAVGGNKYNNDGGSLYGVAKNSNTLNIEMCVIKKDGKWYYEPETLNNTADLVQAKMKQYGIPANRVIRHYDVTGKSCPASYTTDSAWKTLHAKLTGQSNVETEKPSSSISTSSGKLTSYSGYITVTYGGSDKLSYHNTPDFNASSVAGTVGKGTVLTVVGRIKVNGTYMYKTKAGWYITSATEYVKYTKDNPLKTASASSGSTTATSSYYPKYTGDSDSIVTGLNAVGVDSSYSNRKKIATANGISGYSGTASQNTKMLNLLKQGKLKKAGSTSSNNTTTSYYKKYTGSSNSISDALKSIGIDNSYENRKTIAKKNGISNYSGSASQNEKLLSLLKQGKLKK